VKYFPEKFNVQVSEKFLFMGLDEVLTAFIQVMIFWLV